MLTDSDLALHARLGIDADLLEKHQVRRVDDAAARDALALNGRSGRLDGVLYPYLLPGQTRPVTHRLRRDHPDLESGRPKNKYLSGYGDQRHLYFATTDTALLADTTASVVLVEAEKSALAVASAARRVGRNVLAIALGGCFGWRGRIGKTVAPDGGHVDELGALPDFARVAWAARDVLLGFDTNAATNPSVQAARRALAHDVSRRGAAVRILALPVEDGVNGPDDYIGRHGDAGFFALADAATDARTFDVIFRLNETHAVLGEGGKTVVITEDFDPVLRRRVLTRSTFHDFRNRYLNKLVEVGVNKKSGEPIRKPLGHVWLTHSDRRQYQGLIMSPGCEVPGYFNLWRGFAVTPAPGNWSRFYAHVNEVICAGDPTVFAYVLAWLAFGVQHPDRLAEVALALRGKRGTGKGVFARTYGELFGQHYLQIANTKHLTGHFNAHLQDAVVLFADEAFWAGDKPGESVLKMLITEPVIPIERKGRDLVLSKNLLHIIIASNNDWVVPAGMDERRFCVLDVADHYRQDSAYFAGLMLEANSGGREAMLHDLLQHDISTVDLRAAPLTEGLRQQKLLSLQPNEKWLHDKLTAGRWLPTHSVWETCVAKDDLHADYILTLQRVGIDRRSTETELGMFMGRIFSELKTVQRTVEGRRRRCWLVPNLSSCRTTFDAATDCRHPWPDAEDDD